MDENPKPVEGSVNSGTLLPGEILLPSHSPLYIGGVPDLSELPSGAVAGLPVPFSGCVRRLWLNWRSVTLNEQNIIAARNINDCDGTACGGDICFNGGSCWLTADNRPMCNCPQQYIGERCEQQVSCVEVGCENNGRCIKHNKQVRCSCPTGWTGPFCNLEVPTGAPHFGGDSFLVVDSQHILTKRGGGELKDFINIDKQMNDYVITYLYLNFSTAQHDGMILWTSQNNEFLGLGIETGFMKIVWGMHGIIKKEILLPGLLVADGTWHTLTMTTTDKGTVFLTDRTIAHTYTSNASIHTDGIFYLGGFPEDRKVSDETSGYFQKPFSGCIKEIAWNEQFTVLDFSKFTGENVGSCDLIYP